MLVTVATFDFPYQAQIARAKLDAEGIPAFVADEHTVNANWLYSNALGGVRLQVPVSALQQASEILNTRLDVEPVSDAQVDGWTCEKCGSNRTEFAVKGKAWAFLLFFLVEFPIWPVKAKRRCEDCGHTWTLQGNDIATR